MAHKGDVVPRAQTLPVHIALLGGFRLSIDHHAIPDDAWQLRRAKLLIKRLALAPQHQLHREQAIDALWPDAPPATPNNSLHQVLRAARQALALTTPEAATLLSLHDEILALCPHSPLWIDTIAFQDAAATAFQSTDPAACHAALDLYTGDLLPEDLYDDWTAERREALRHTYLDLLLALATLHQERHDDQAAITTLRRVLTVDPAHEESHARLMGLLAATGQRSQALHQYQLLVDSLQRELDVAPHPRTARLYQSILAGHFPAPAATSPHPGAPQPTAHGPRLKPFPTPVNSFIGRERETVELATLLRTARLLTLTGPGGCGKTRLALHLAAELQATFADGASFVDLSGLAHAPLLPHVVVAALDLTEQSSRPLIETLTAHLQSRHLLLILDNCEHLIDACAALADHLARHCPRLHLLATSREPLHIPGEVTWRLASLTLPTPTQPRDPDALAQVDAVHLFLDRARAILPTFTLDTHNAPAVVHLCRQLDGIPLAIELAAARLTALSVDQIDARLDDCFRLLTIGSRTALSRQQTLKAALDWSYDLLDPAEQLLFRRLAVFAGGFDLDAAEAVAGDATLVPTQILDLLTRLVDKSLVTVTPHGNTLRYRLLEPIRQYAAHRLHEASEASSIRTQHRDWFCTQADQARHALWTRDHAVALLGLETDHDNLRAALDSSLSDLRAAGEVLDAATRLVAALWQFWLLRGHLAEGRRWLDRLLSRVPARSADHAAALLYHYCLSMRLGDMATARPAAEDCLAIYRDLQNVPGMVNVASTFCASLCMDGAYTRAHTLFTALVALARSHDDHAGTALATYNLGMIAWWQGHYDRAAALIEESLMLFRRAPHRDAIASGFPNFGFFVTMRGGDELPTGWIEETVSILREVGTATMIGFTLANLGNLSRDRGNNAQAWRYLTESLSHFRTIEDRSGLAQVLNQLGNLARADGQYEQSECYLTESLTLRRNLGERLGLGRTLNSLGTLALARGDAASAQSYYDESMALYREIGDRPGIVGTLYLVAQLALATGNNGTARALFADGAALEEEMHRHGPHVALFLLGAGIAAQREGDTEAAHAAFTRSLTLFQQLGDQGYAARLHHILLALIGADGGAIPAMNP